MLEDESVVVDALARVVTIAPKYAEYLGVEVSDDGEVDVEAIARAAESRVVVRSMILYPK